MSTELICKGCKRSLTPDAVECWECKFPVHRKLDLTSGERQAAAVAAAPRYRGRAALYSVPVIFAAIVFWFVPMRLGRVTIQTVPPGAAVQVGDHVLGVTPLQIQGSAGEYWVSIKLDDYEEVRTQVRIPVIGNSIANLPLRKLPEKPRSAPSEDGVTPRSAAQTLFAARVGLSD